MRALDDRVVAATWRNFTHSRSNTDLVFSYEDKQESMNPHPDSSSHLLERSKKKNLADCIRTYEIRERVRLGENESGDADHR